MKNLTKNRREWYVILKDDRQFAITEEQYQTIFLSDQYGKYNDSLIIRDCDTNEIVYNGKLGAIKEYRKINKGKTIGIQFICDFGERHPIEKTCNCFEKFGIFPGEFKKTAMSFFGKMYLGSLTNSEKIIIRSHCKKNNPPIDEGLTAVFD